MNESESSGLRGFSDGDYYDRLEYDHERVACLETGLYERISTLTDSLLISPGVTSGVLGEGVPEVVYSSESRAIARRFSRLDFNADDPVPTKTTVDIKFRNEIDSPRCNAYAIEVKKESQQLGGNVFSMSSYYEMVQYLGSDQLSASVIYPDIANDTYASRPMTPYDEIELYRELDTMAAYLSIEGGDLDASLANE